MSATQKAAADLASSLKDLEEVRAANLNRLLAVAASVQHAIKITNTKLEATK